MQAYLESHPEALAEFVEQHPQIVATFARRTSHSGPLPPPETLREFGQVLPGLDERIVRMAEKEQEHRHGVQRELVRIVGRGQILAFAFGIAGLICGALLALKGMEGFGIAAILSGASLLVSAFLFGRRGQPGKNG